ETAEADGGNADGAPGDEVAVVVEGGEEGDAEAAVGHGVEKAVACSGEKEVSPNPSTRGKKSRGRSRSLAAVCDNSLPAYRGQSATGLGMTITAPRFKNRT